MMYLNGDLHDFCLSTKTSNFIYDNYRNHAWKEDCMVKTAEKNNGVITIEGFLFEINEVSRIIDKEIQNYPYFQWPQTIRKS